MTLPRLAPPPTGRRSPARRVIVLVADGLRPDVVPLLDLPAFDRLAREGASTLGGRTVRPSVTAAAMGSLLTGVEPEVHGLVSDRFRIPRSTGLVEPLPAVVAAAAMHSGAWMARLPWAYRRLGHALVSRLGFGSVSFNGACASEILESARPCLSSGREGLYLMHWPDADRMGHEHGWPSPPYLNAVRSIDRCLEELDAISGASSDPGTLLVVLADHGGGGATRRDHDSDHPLDRTIPIILAGGCVRSGQVLRDASLLDIPPTVLHALGLGIPESYVGRVLHEAFTSNREMARATRSRRWVEGIPVPFAAAG